MEIDRDLIIDRVSFLVTPLIEVAGFELVDLELVGRQNNYSLRFLIDKPGGVALKDCVAINHEVSNLLDVEDPIPSRYTLEVSSPGLDRPFKKTRDYQRAIGKPVKIIFVNDFDQTKSLIGHLVGIEDGIVKISNHKEDYNIRLECIKKAQLDLG